jgi:hypothetical protein
MPGAEHKFPPTLIVKSGGKGAAHIYMLQNEWSRKLGNRSAMGLFDLQSIDKYVVGPGSTLGAGQVYRIIDASTLAEFPVWLYEWIAKHSMPEKSKKHGEHPVDEDFDFDDFCEHYGITGHQDGDYFVTDICPVAGRKHQHSEKTGFFWDGTSLGWHCFATQFCEGSNMKIGEVIRFLNKTHEPYREVIWPQETLEKTLAAFDIEIEAANVMPEIPQEEQQIKDMAFRMGVKVKEEPEPPVDPKALKYPELQFPYEAIPPGRLRKLVDKACEGGLNPGLVVPAILTLVSALPRQDEMDGTRINLYTPLLALSGGGKDIAMKRALSVLGMWDDPDTYREYTPSGERSIATMIGDKAGTKDNPGRIPGPERMVFVTYELKDTLNKSVGDTSSVLEAINWYYDHNRKPYTDTRHNTVQTVDCRLSWLSGLAVGLGEIDTDKYRRAFGESSTDGIARRLAFGFAEVPFDARRTRNWKPDASLYQFGETDETNIDGVGPVFTDNRTSLVDELRDAVVEGFAPGIEEQYLNWEPKNPSDTYLAHKWAILTALIQGHKYIEQSDWDFTVTCMDWQFLIQTTFAPGRARRVTQGEFQEKIMLTMRKCTDKLIASRKNTYDAKTVTYDGATLHFIRWKKMANDGKWWLDGMDVEQTIRRLVNMGALAFKEELECSANGKDENTKTDEIWVRLC